MLTKHPDTPTFVKKICNKVKSDKSISMSNEELEIYKKLKTESIMKQIKKMSLNSLFQINKFFKQES